MSWFNTLKFTPELRRLAGGEEIKVIALGSEQQMKEMWDASNPKIPHELRDGKARTSEYPVNEWFGVIVKQGDKYRLVAISGFSVKQGKDGKEYAYKGGTKSSVGGKDYGLMAREKALSNKPSVPTIAGYTDEGAKWITGDMPEQHDVIPDEVIAHFNKHYPEQWDVVEKYDWSKSPMRQTNWEERLLSAGDKYMAFWKKLYTIMANSKLTPSRIKLLAGFGAINLPLLWEKAKQEYNDERSKELKKLIEQAMREN